MRVCAGPGPGRSGGLRAGQPRKKKKNDSGAKGKATMPDINCKVQTDSFQEADGRDINCEVQTDSFQEEDRRMLVEALTKFQRGLKKWFIFGMWRSVRGAIQARDHLQT